MSAAQRLPSALEIKCEIISNGGPLQGKSLVFQQEVIRLGRGPENDISLAHDLKVSREHCSLEVSNKSVYLKCINEKNPVWVDGNWIQQKQLPPGSLIRLGETEIRLIFKGGVSTAVPILDSPAKEISNHLVKATSLGPVSEGLLKRKSQVAGLSPVAPRDPSTSSKQVPVGSYNYVDPSRGVKGSRRDSDPRVSINDGVSGSRKLFFGIILGIAGLFVFMFSQDPARTPQGVQLRDRVVSEANIKASEAEVDTIEKEFSQQGKDTVQFRLAEEQFHRGFRDYLNGQYSRAMEQFNAALSFFPEHRQARRYFHLARRKFDQQIQSHMKQGQRYYGIQNYRLCASFYSKVVTMIRDTNNAQRKEAVQYLKECQLRLQAGGL